MPCINDAQEQMHKKKYKCNCTCPSYKACKEGGKELGLLFGMVDVMNEMSEFGEKENKN